MNKTQRVLVATAIAMASITIPQAQAQPADNPASSSEFLINYALGILGLPLALPLLSALKAG